MKTGVLDTAIEIVGIGGLSLVVLLLLYKDLLRKLKVPGLDQRQWYKIIIIFMILVCSITIVGIFAWMYTLPQQKAADKIQLQKTIYMESKHSTISAKYNHENNSIRVKFTKPNILLQNAKLIFPKKLYGYPIDLDNEKRSFSLYRANYSIEDYFRKWYPKVGDLTQFVDGQIPICVTLNYGLDGKNYSTHSIHYINFSIAISDNEIQVSESGFRDGEILIIREIIFAGSAFSKEQCIEDANLIWNAAVRKRMAGRKITSGPAIIGLLQK